MNVAKRRFVCGSWKMWSGYLVSDLFISMRIDLNTVLGGGNQLTISYTAVSYLSEHLWPGLRVYLLVLVHTLRLQPDDLCDAPA